MVVSSSGPSTASTARQLPKKDNQRRNTETHRQLANDIWSICNLLRGPYKRNEYRKVILPLTVLRRFDCLLAPTKPQALITFNA
jgi:type I restriction-modification system DNA methylase subunit